MGGASCRECVERRAAQPVGRGAVQQMGAPLLRLLGVSNRPVEGEEVEGEGMTMMTMAREMMEVRGQQEQQEEEAEEAEEEEEEGEAAEAEGEQLGGTPAIPQTMGRIRTQSQT